MGAGASLYTSPDPYAYDAALAQLEAPEDTFRKSFSADGDDATIDLEAFREAAKQLLPQEPHGVPAPVKDIDIERAFQKADVNGEGKIGMHEFAAYSQRLTRIAKVRGCGPTTFGHRFATSDMQSSHSRSLVFV